MKYYLPFLLLFVVGCGDIGGMRGDYPARDYDPELTAIAQEAVPLIQMIEGFHDEKGRYPSYEELNQLHPIRSGQGWMYSEREDYFQVFYQLGWDPTLRFDSRDRSWTFEPGDGSPSRQVALAVETEPEQDSDGNAEKPPGVERTQ